MNSIIQYLNPLIAPYESHSPITGYITTTICTTNTGIANDYCWILPSSDIRDQLVFFQYSFQLIDGFIDLMLGFRYHVNELTACEHQNYYFWLCHSVD